MNKLEELTQKIAEAKELYYTFGASPYSDAEYDRMVEQAERLGFIDYVGSKPAAFIPTIKHEHLMLSLDKVHSVNEIKKFENVTHGRDIVFMWKLDGLSVSATYIDGVLTRLETRGNGTEGNDILFHANSFMNLPKYINHKGKYVIDGECVILQGDFNRINTKGEFSNPRNLAAGSLNQLDPNISKERKLRFYAWDVIEGGNTNYLFRNLLEAENLGFDIVRMVVGDDVVFDIDGTLERMKALADEVGMPIDGIVIKYDDIKFGASLGRTDHHFKCGIAYKYQDEIKKTKLITIEWQVGKNQIINPVAIFEPVNINNSKIERASLSNLTIMKKILGNPYVGQNVYVKKSGMIIPQIVYAEKE